MSARDRDEISCLRYQFASLVEQLQWVKPCAEVRRKISIQSGRRESPITICLCYLPAASGLPPAPATGASSAGALPAVGA